MTSQGTARPIGSSRPQRATVAIRRDLMISCTWPSESTPEDALVLRSDVATVATLEVRLGSERRSFISRKSHGYAADRTQANPCERLPTLAMQKVVGSSPIIRSTRARRCAAIGYRGEVEADSRRLHFLCRYELGPLQLCPGVAPTYADCCDVLQP
jgi:hypothetical protein